MHLAQSYRAFDLRHCSTAVLIYCYLNQTGNVCDVNNRHLNIVRLKRSIHEIDYSSTQYVNKVNIGTRHHYFELCRNKSILRVLGENSCYEKYPYYILVIARDFVHV